MTAGEETASEIESPEPLPSDGVTRYCSRCLEPLSFFASGPWYCWKCSRRFDPHDAKTYSSQRALLRWKYWFPGFCLAVGAGVLVYALLVATGALAIALAIAAAVSLGALLGYGASVRVRVAATAMTMLAAALAAVALAGPFAGSCVAFSAAIGILIPTALGIMAGVVLRVVLEQSNWDQRWYFPTLLAALLPTMAGWI